MGYIAHDTIVAKVSEEDRVDLEDFRESLPEEWRPLLVSVPALVNGGQFWAFMPDGSKEYWDTSDEGDTHRQNFVNLLAARGIDYAAVRWGGDFGAEFGTVCLS